MLNAGLPLPLSAMSSQVQEDKSKACGFSLESVSFYAVGDFSINSSLMFSAPVSPEQGLQGWDALGSMNVGCSQTEGCTPLLLDLKVEQEDAEALCKEAGVPDASTSCTDPRKFSELRDISTLTHL